MIMKYIAALLILAVFCTNCVLRYVNYNDLVLHCSCELLFSYVTLFSSPLLKAICHQLKM